MSEGFASLGLSRETMAALKGAKLDNPTPLQGRIIKDALLGRDIVAVCTPDGRAEAFLVSLIERLAAMPNTRALILSRNKQRVSELHTLFDTLATGRTFKVTEILAGGSMPAQEQELREKRAMLLAMPGRLTEHMDRGAVNFSSIEMVVLDGADDLIADGLLPQVKRIVQRLPPRRQTIIVTEKLVDSLASFAKTFLRDPIMIDMFAAAPATEPAKVIKKATEKLEKPVEKPTKAPVAEVADPATEALFNHAIEKVEKPGVKAPVVPAKPAQPKKPAEKQPEKAPAKALEKAAD